MKFYSETLDTFFDTPEACLKAEEEVEQKKKAEAARKAEIEKNRAKRAKEVEKAILNARQAIEERDALLRNFINDYGAFHMSLDSKATEPKQLSIHDLFETLF